MSADVTKTSICNLALSAIKLPGITDITEASESARQCATQYDPCRREALRGCDWNFATVAKALALLGDQQTASDSPTDQTKQDVYPQFYYLYGKPGNCVRVRKVFNSRIPISADPFTEFVPIEPGPRPPAFKLVRSPITNIEAIATNVAGAWAEFTYDIVDESQFDDMFSDAFSLLLALNLVMPLTGDKELAAMIAAQAKASFDEAMRKNGGEGTEFTSKNSEYQDVRGR